jgi:hypothetical protein
VKKSGKKWKKVEKSGKKWKKVKKSEKKWEKVKKVKKSGEKWEKVDFGPKKPGEWRETPARGFKKWVKKFFSGQFFSLFLTF